MSLLREAGWHLGARGFSALASSSVFALLARLNTPADAKAVFFFMFASGFVVAFLRSFCMFAAALQGPQRRTERLRRVHALARRYALLLPLFAALSAAALSSQALPPLWIALSTLIILSAGFDADLLRAALGRGPLFSPAFAVGSVAALGVLTLGKPGITTGALAVLCPWIALALVNAPLAWRLLRRRSRPAPPGQPDSARHWPAALLTALYDGTVLNLPFFAGNALAEMPGLDLAVAARLYSSAQPFFPLVLHWAGSGRLTEIARRLGLRETLLFGLLLVASGLLASMIFVTLFSLIGRQPVTAAQFMMFAALLFGYVLFATAARFTAPRLAPSLRLRQVAILLTLFVALWFGGSRWLTQSAVLIVALQVAALAGLAASTTALARLSSGGLPPGK